MLESLILAVCLKGSSGACDRSLRAYYHTPTPITQTVKKYEDEAVRAYKEVPVLELIGPVVGVAVQGEATFKITSNISTNISPESFRIIWEIPL